jgi:hypothetical protein
MTGTPLFARGVTGTPQYRIPYSGTPQLEMSVGIKGYNVNRLMIRVGGI